MESGNKPRQANSLLNSPKKQGYKGKTLEISVVPKYTETELTNGLKIMKGFVDDKPITILRDTGCTAIFITEQLVDASKVSVQEKEVTLADGTVRKCKEVQVKFDTPYISGVGDAFVMSNPFADLVIGNIGHVYPELQTPVSFQSVTRSMTEKSKYEEILYREADEEWKKDDYKPNTSETTTDRDENIEEILNADDLVLEQTNDLSLRKVRELAKGPVTVSRNAFFYDKDSILYRDFYDQSNVVVHQVVVPKKYRKRLMQVVRDIPFGGHMGNRKKIEKDCYKTSFGLVCLKMLLNIVGRVHNVREV